MLGWLLTGHVAVFGLLGSCFHFSGASGSEATSVVFTAKEDVKGKQEDSGFAIGHRIPTTPASSHPSSLPTCCLSSALLSGGRDCFFSLKGGQGGTLRRAYKGERLGDAQVGCLLVCLEWLILACSGVGLGTCQSCGNMHLVEEITLLEKENLILHSLNIWKRYPHVC